MTESILKEAEKLVGGARRQEYGHPIDNFADIAKMWSVILSDDGPVTVTSQQVIDCMIALKLCRAKQGYKRDTYIDIAGYARCAELINED